MAKSLDGAWPLLLVALAAEKSERVRQSVVEQQAYIFFWLSYKSSVDRLLVAASPEGSALDPCMTRICTDSVPTKRSYCTPNLRIIALDKSKSCRVSCLSPSRLAPFRGSLSLPEAPSFWPAGCAWRPGAYGLAYPIQWPETLAGPRAHTSKRRR